MPIHKVSSLTCLISIFHIDLTFIVFIVFGLLTCLCGVEKNLSMFDSDVKFTFKESDSTRCIFYCIYDWLHK